MTDAPSAARAPRILWAARAGAFAILPTQLFVVPFGLVSGVVAGEIGLDFVQTMFLSVALFAGASQFAVMDLLADGAPVLVIVAAGLAVNLRLVMYAASLSTWLREASLGSRALVGYLNIDNAYAVASVWYRRQPEASAAERAAFHISGAVVTWLVWQTATVIGFFFGAAAPAYLALEFSAPIAFIALAAPVLVDRPSWLAAATAIALAIAFKDLAFNLGVVIGGIGGVAAGWLADRAAERRRAQEAGGDV